MEKFRIGHDLTVFWAINNNDGTPYDLGGKDVRLFVISPRGRKRESITVQGNVIGWEFLGKDQRFLGEYSLTAEIYTAEGKRSIKKDVIDAFALVGNSCLECTDEDDANIKEGGELTLASQLDIYRIFPIIPQIGEDGNWIVDGEDTGMPSRGQAGSAVELAYVSMTVDENMELGFDYVPSGSSDNIEFELNEEGELVAHIEKSESVGGASASFVNLVEVESWEYDGNGKKFFPENKFEQAISGSCSILYKGVIYHAQQVMGRMVIYSTAYMPDIEVKYQNVSQIAVNLDTREVVENYTSIPPIEESPEATNLDENTSFLVATGEGVRRIPVMGLLGELVNMMIELESRVSALEQKIN